MMYEQLIIYYFSGTGNARNASKWILQVAEEQGIRTQLINIDRFEEIEPPNLKVKTLVGFCSPTHGFNLPPIVLKFIFRFPKVKKTDAFILNTRGGLKIFRYYLPGLSGVAQFLPAVILISKGFRIIGMQPLDLPSNWLILHPGLGTKTINSIYNRCREIARNFATKILSGKRKYKAFLSLPLDLAIIPVALGYYLIGRFFLAKTLVATHMCNNCEKCIVQCPVRAISLVKERPFWSYKCESCMRCVNTCPQRAIETTHSFSASLIIISSLVISPALLMILKYFEVEKLVYQSGLTENIWSLINTVIFLLFVFVSYRILHYLMRYKFINTIISYTSLSKYRFWRRYKAPKM